MSTKIGDIVGKLKLNIDDFKKNINNAQKEVGKMPGQFDKVVSSGQKLEQVGHQIDSSMSAPARRFVSTAFESAVGYEKAMARVQMVTGATGDDFDKLGKLAIEMKNSTVYSAEEAADGIYYLGQAGWDTNQIYQGLPHVLNLATAAQMDLGRAADITSDIMAAFGLEAHEAARVADVLAVTSTETNTSVEMLGEGMKYVAPISGALGLSIEETATVLGLMSDRGIKASQSGTTLRRALLDLTNGSAEAEAMFEELNIQFYEQDGTARGLQQVFGDLEVALEGMTEAEKMHAMQTMFSTTSLAGMFGVVGAGGEEFDKLHSKLINSTGASQEMADVMMDTTYGALNQFKSAVDTLGITLMTHFLPAIADVLTRISEMIIWFTKLDPNVQKVIMSFILFTAALGPVLIYVGKVMQAIKILIPVIMGAKGAFLAIKSVAILVGGIFKTVLLVAIKGIVVILTKLAALIMGAVIASFKALITVLALPVVKIGLIIAAITALIYWFVNLIKNNEEFQQFWIDMWDRVVEVITQAKEWIGERLTAIGDFFTDLWNNVVESTTEWINNMWTGITTWWDDTWTGFTQWWNNIRTGFNEWWSELWTGFREWCSGVLNDINQWFSDIWNGFTQWWNELLTGFTTWWNDTWSGFTEWCSNIWSGLSEWWADIWTGFTQWWSELFAGFREWWAELLNGFSEWWNDVTKGFREWWDGLVTWFVELPARMREFATNMWKGFVDGIRGRRRNVTDEMKDSTKEGEEHLSGLGNESKTWGAHMMEGMEAGIESRRDRVIGAAKGVADRVTDFLGFTVPDDGPLSRYMEWMPHFMEGMRDQLNKHSYKLIDAAEDVAHEMSDIMNDDLAVSAFGSDINADGSSYEGDITVHHEIEGVVDKLDDLVTKVIQVAREPREYNFNIDELHVENENDIREISQELYKLMKRDNSGLGRG